MLALDTNVLVRVLVDDPSAPDQCQRARRAVSEAGEVMISQVVQIETVRVLASAYGLDRQALQGVLGTVAAHPAFHLQRPEVFQSGLERYLDGHGDFAACVILAEGAAANFELATFDRKLARLPGTRLLA